YAGHTLYVDIHGEVCPSDRGEAVIFHPCVALLTVSPSNDTGAFGYSFNLLKVAGLLRNGRIPYDR
ncbi:22147_t:CDS:2, partial [Dentiscutata erythropus]